MRNEVLGLLKFKGVKNLIVKNQDVDDIMKIMIDQHNINRKDYDKICHLFIRENEVKTLKAIFDFLKKDVKYKIESGEEQKVKSPGAIVYTGKTTGSDCKGYASFINGCIDAINRTGKMKIPFCYRFANYRIIDNVPQHVFSVAYPGTSGEIWIDPVLPFFDQKKKYYNKIDKMPLYTVSGLPTIGRKSRAERKSARKSRRKARREGENCTGRLAMKYAPPAVVARKSFLLLMDVNVRKLGTKMVMAFKNPNNRLKIINQWCKFGGNAETLIRAVQNKERKLKSKGKISGEIEINGMIGVDPATITAAISAAAPLIALIARYLPAGSTGQEIFEAAGDVAETAGEYGDQVSGCSNQLVGCAADCNCDKISGAFSFGPLPILIAAGVGLYFLLK
jgi:hypothetical protein